MTSGPAQVRAGFFTIFFFFFFPPIGNQTSQVHSIFVSFAKNHSNKLVNPSLTDSPAEIRESERERLQSSHLLDRPWWRRGAPQPHTPTCDSPRRARKSSATRATGMRLRPTSRPHDHRQDRLHLPPPGALVAAWARLSSGPRSTRLGPIGSARRSRLRLHQLRRPGRACAASFLALPTHPFHIAAMAGADGQVGLAPRRGVRRAALGVCLALLSLTAPEGRAEAGVPRGRPGRGSRAGAAGTILSPWVFHEASGVLGSLGKGGGIGSVLREPGGLRRAVPCPVWGWGRVQAAAGG